MYCCCFFLPEATLIALRRLKRRKEWRKITQERWTTGSEWIWRNSRCCQNSLGIRSRKPSCLTWEHQKDQTERLNLFWVNSALRNKGNFHFQLTRTCKALFFLVARSNISVLMQDSPKLAIFRPSLRPYTLGEFYNANTNWNSLVILFLGKLLTSDKRNISF